MLKAAFVQGRLTKDELDLRVGLAFASRTYAELAALTADIPARPAAGQPRHMPAQAPAPVEKAARWGACLTVAAAMLVAAWISGSGNTPGRLFAVVMLIPFCVLIMTGLLTFHSRLDEHSDGQRPPGPGRRGQAHEGRRGGRDGHRRIRSRAGSDQTGAELRRYRSQHGQSGPSKLAAGAARRGVRTVPGAV
jgi:hypothetical protein